MIHRMRLVKLCLIPLRWAIHQLYIFGHRNSGVAFPKSFCLLHYPDRNCKHRNWNRLIADTEARIRPFIHASPMWAARRRRFHWYFRQGRLQQSPTACWDGSVGRGRQSLRVLAEGLTLCAVYLNRRSHPSLRATPPRQHPSLESKESLSKYFPRQDWGESHE